MKKLLLALTATTALTAPAMAEQLALEKDVLTFGFIKLTDMAPLAVAYEQGYFDDEGLFVTLEAQANWKVLLDGVISGTLDGAHMLAGQPLAATIGFGTEAYIITPFSMDLNGNGITVSKEIWEQMKPNIPEVDGKPQHPISAAALAPVVEKYKSEGKPFNMGMVFPVSTHNYELRYWLAAGGLHPGFYSPEDISGQIGADVLLSVTPPPQMPATLEAGTIYGYCVGEPWNQQAVFKGTPSGKGRMLPLHYRPPASATSPKRPFRLNTGRLRDQWHTMTRTAKSPRLAAHLPEPFLEIHPDDAARLGLAPAALVEVASDHGRSILRARITDAVRQGEVFAPMHWTGETAPSARIDALVAPHTDPVSGQPESKAAAVSVAPFAANWYGFAVSARAPKLSADYWALARTDRGYRAELAGREAPADWEARAREIFDLPGADAQLFADPARGIHRIALFEGGALASALFVSREPAALMRDYLATLPGEAAPGVLSARAPADRPDPGPVICSCFGVGINTIVAAIEAQGLTTVDEIGTALQAGTNCGSCRAELFGILQAQVVKQAAE
ncbi:MAG: ABC transporter substrate-binding protein [Paracoccaceae bacterium]